jgi:hypothetical protein
MYKQTESSLFSEELQLHLKRTFKKWELDQIQSQLRLVISVFLGFGCDGA